MMPVEVLASISKVLKVNASGAWACGLDKDTTYTGADFALSNQVCGAGMVAKGFDVTGDIVCTPAGTYSAGPGLVLKDNVFSLPMTCTAGDVLKWNAATKTWDCMPDSMGVYSAGTGLALEGTTFSLDQTTVENYAKGVCYDTPDEVKAAGFLKTTDKLTEGMMPANGLNEVSNGLLTNQFADTVASTTATPANPLKIADNNPTGTSDTISFPDIGLAESLKVNVDISNHSNISELTIKLYDPNNVEYVLHKKTGSGSVLKTSYPTPTQPVSGDLTTWVGKNPKGNWRILIIDDTYDNNTFDGLLNSWSITIQTLSNKKVHVNGDLLVTGNVGIGTASPQAKLDVAGLIKAKGLDVIAYTAGGPNSPGVYLSSSNNWADFPDLSITFNLAQPTAVLVQYEIAMNGNSSHLVTRLVVDGNIVSRSITGNTAYWSEDSVWFGELAQGTHTVTVQYRTPAGGYNNPAGEDWQNRLLQVLVFGS